MAERQIPQEDWIEFCAAFSRQHSGWLVSLEEVESGHEPRILVRDEPLKAVSAELDETGENKIVISAGKEPASRTLQAVRRPASLGFEVTPDGAHQGLRIDAENGPTIRLRFRTAARPEALDGYTPSV